MDGKRPQQVSERRKAQAVVELTVFGAIVIYLIGLILSQGTNTAYQQDMQLQAMRAALLASANSSNNNRTERSYASFMILEDRLVPGAGRYGSSERAPFLISGSGTMTKMMFYPLDWEDISSGGGLGVSDIRINGQQFAMRGGMAVTYRIRYIPTDVLGGGAQSWTNSQVTISQVGGCSGYCDTSCEKIVEDSKLGLPMTPIGNNQAMFFSPDDPNVDAKRLLFEWIKYPLNGYPPAYVAAVANDKGAFVPPQKCVPDNLVLSDYNYDKLRRYDLNRDGAFPDMCCPNPLAYMVWQWTWTSLDDVISKINPDDGMYPGYDVDGDLVEEQIYKLTKWDKTCSGVYTMGYDVQMIDGDRGDMDSVSEPSDFADPRDVPGLKQDMRIITTQKAGTYASVKEDQSGVAGRSTSTVKRNQEDKVERLFVLNRRMLGGGSLCSGSTPLQKDVEVCCTTPNCCGTGGAQDFTCLEAQPNSASAYSVKKLFIRSLIKEQRGRRWTTDVTP